ncbi:MAG: recombinase RecA [Deltaproteobacteria bacterium]|nr:recombinase RecA [Deltaproteobacteria bacterium]|tara:strand:- start:536 stop:1678 length:1143 start_codon:yes stop_codon:yes gene_type:complete
MNLKTEDIPMRKAVSDKKSALDAAISNIEKQFGKGSIMKLGEYEDSIQQIPAIPTGSLGLDVALGVGGYPRGRIIEVYGPESSGKTTLALHAIAQIQKQGGTCAFIDAEHALDIKYARRLGVNSDALLISQPDYGEQALEIVETLIRSAAIDLIVVDSVAALVPKSEIEGDMGDSHVGLQARLMSQACRKIAGVAGTSNTTVFFINQLRMKIGVMFGNPETTTGGNALKFYASVRLDVRRTGAIKSSSGNVMGNQTRVKVVKNKVAPPFQQAEFDILYNEGISLTGEILDRSVDQGFIQKSGAWYSHGTERIGQGRENARRWLSENDEVREELYQKLLATYLPHLHEGEEGAKDEAAKKEATEEVAEETTTKSKRKKSKK